MKESERVMEPQATTADVLAALPGMLLRRSNFPYIDVSPPIELTALAAPLVQRLQGETLSTFEMLNHPLVAIVGNVYRRMGDLEFYFIAIEDQLQSPALWRAATLTGSFLTGYFSAAKSLLDAVAIAVDHLYNLGLAPKNQDLMKEAIWTALSHNAPDARKRYAPMRAFFKEVKDWRDSAVHRVAPLVMVAMKDSYVGHGPPAPGEGSVRMSSSLTTAFVANDRSVKWIDPLDMPRRWRPLFCTLCASLAADLAVRSSSTSARDT